MIKFNQYRQQLKRLAVRAVCLVMVSMAVWGGAWVPGSWPYLSQPVKCSTLGLPQS